MLPADYCLYVNRRRNLQADYCLYVNRRRFFLSAPPDIFTYAALLKNPSVF